MQTLKTAAVVVLLMAVMYSAYISMTAPPQEISPELTGLVLDAEDFNIDSGFAESGDSLAFDIGSPEPTGQIASAGGNTPPSLSNPPSFSNDVLNDLASTATSSPESAGTFAAEAAGSQDMLGGQRVASRDLSGLPKVTGPGNVTVDPNRDYPTTGGSFNLPSPDQAASTFDPGDGPTFAPVDDSSVSVTTGTDAASSPAPTEPTKNLGLQNAFRTADTQYAADQRKEALATLSVFYGTPGLTDQERSELLNRLDPLAGEVIYSQRHLLEQPYRVRVKETLMDIAAGLEVPWQLLQNINRVQDPILLVPGKELKVIRGPFRTEIDLNRKELTLFLGDLYAGRFPIEVGNDPQPQPGTYTVQDKLLSKTFYDKSGLAIQPGNPNNPYGSMWIDLGNNLSIHGSPSPSRPTSAGCISVAGDHATDLVGILSQGSAVTIRR